MTTEHYQHDPTQPSPVGQTEQVSIQQPDTVEVPTPRPAHPDSGETPVVTDTPTQTPEITPKRFAKKWVAGTVAALVTAGATYGFLSQNHETAAEHEPQSTSGALVPGPTESAAPSTTPTAEAAPTPKTAAELVKPGDIPVVQSSLVEIGTYANLTPEKQQWMQTMNNMDAAEFFAQPQEDQLTFVMQVFDNERVAFDGILKLAGVNNLHYTDNPTTSQQRADNTTYLELMLHYFYMHTDGDQNNVPTYDSSLSQKMHMLILLPANDAVDSWTQDYGTESFAERPNLKLGYNDLKLTVNEDEQLPDGSTLANVTLSDGRVAQNKYVVANYTDLQDGSTKTVTLVEASYASYDPRVVDLSQ